MNIPQFDSEGNKYEVLPDNYLKVSFKHDSRNVVIGTLKTTKRGLVIYEKKENAAHIYRKTNSWSINWHVAQIADYFYFYTENESYKISREDAINFGKVQKVSKKSETKLYVPLQYWIKKSEVVK